ncbi:hypothetical protein [Halalkalibacterium ligniniphilum]|uniref:hypothetical protein n=1 Tax=Halalkalibacterium ligniniphilum TaxID=1134413 RepID=UPI000344F97A|nr:hypothetical protein [Halalkalibacterium ligniniphilum]
MFVHLKKEDFKRLEAVLTVNKIEEDLLTISIKADECDIDLRNGSEGMLVVNLHCKGMTKIRSKALFELLEDIAKEKGFSGIEFPQVRAKNLIEELKVRLYVNKYGLNEAPNKEGYYVYYF